MLFSSVASLVVVRLICVFTVLSWLLASCIVVLETETV